MNTSSNIDDQVFEAVRKRSTALLTKCLQLQLQKPFSQRLFGLDAVGRSPFFRAVESGMLNMVTLFLYYYEFIVAEIEQDFSKEENAKYFRSDEEKKRGVQDAIENIRVSSQIDAAAVVAATYGKMDLVVLLLDGAPFFTVQAPVVKKQQQLLSTDPLHQQSPSLSSSSSEAVALSSSSSPPKATAAAAPMTSPLSLSPPKKQRTGQHQEIKGGKKENSFSSNSNNASASVEDIVVVLQELFPNNPNITVVPAGDPSSSLVSPNLKKVDKKRKNLFWASPNACDSTGYSVLHGVASQGYVKAVTLLIGKGARLSVADADGHTPLHLASASNKNEKLIFLLMMNGADINARDGLAMTPLHVAVVNSQNEILKLFLSKEHCHVNTRESSSLSGSTPLIDAIRLKNKKAIQLLFSSEEAKAKPAVDVNFTNAKGISPIEFAVLSGNTFALKQMLLLGPGAKSATEQTRQQQQQQQQQQELCKFDEDHIVDFEKNTLLHEAVRLQYFRVIRSLCEFSNFLRIEQELDRKTQQQQQAQQQQRQHGKMMRGGGGWRSRMGQYHNNNNNTYIDLSGGGRGEVDDVESDLVTSSGGDDFEEDEEEEEEEFYSDEEEEEEDEFLSDPLLRRQVREETRQRLQLLEEELTLRADLKRQETQFTNAFKRRDRFILFENNQGQTAIDVAEDRATFKIALFLKNLVSVKRKKRRRKKKNSGQPHPKYLYRLNNQKYSDEEDDDEEDEENKLEQDSDEKLKQEIYQTLMEEPLFAEEEEECVEEEEDDDAAAGGLDDPSASPPSPRSRRGSMVSQSPRSRRGSMVAQWPRSRTNSIVA